MATFVLFNRDQAFLLLPDLKAWLPDDDLALLVAAAVERVPLGAFDVAARPGGKPQHHPRLMLALLIHSHANAIFSPRRIERATCRDVAMRFVAANLHPDHASPPERQSNLSDPDSVLMRRSDAHEYRQACNAQAVVCADGAQLIVAILVATSAGAPSFAATILAMQDTVGLTQRCQSSLQEARADRRTRVRHRQKRHGPHTVPPARPAQGRHRVDLDHPALQLQAATPPEGRLNLSTPTTANPSNNPNPTGC